MAASTARSTASGDSLSVEPPSSPRSNLHSDPPPRHVLFSELPPKHRSGERCRPVCLAIVAWTCLAAFACVLVILLLGVLLAALLHSNLPAIGVRSVRFALLELSRGAVTAEADFAVEFDNRNDRTALEFGPMALEASVGRVGLGRTRIQGFSQAARNATIVKASTWVRGAAADSEDAEEIKAGPIAVVLKGHVAFFWGRIKFRNVPVRVTCSAVVVSDDERRTRKSPCTVRVIPV